MARTLEAVCCREVWGLRQGQRMVGQVSQPAAPTGTGLPLLPPGHGRLPQGSCQAGRRGVRGCGMGCSPASPTLSSGGCLPVPLSPSGLITAQHSWRPGSPTPCLAQCSSGTTIISPGTEGRSVLLAEAAAPGQGAGSRAAGGLWEQSGVSSLRAPGLQAAVCFPSPARDPLQSSGTKPQDCSSSRAGDRGPCSHTLPCWAPCGTTRSSLAATAQPQCAVTGNHTDPPERAPMTRLPWGT